MQKYHFTPPFKYEPDGAFIVDANWNKVIDIRGWGYLNGFLKMSKEDSTKVQDAMAERLVKFMNSEEF